MKSINVKLAGSKPFEEASSILKKGGICAFPTETVFGLGANAENTEAVRKIFEIKGRNFQKPLALHVREFDMALKYIKSVPEEAQSLIERYVPGPLMMIFEKTDHVKDIITGGLPKIGIRVPSNPTFQNLSKAFSGTIAATSANISGHYSPVKKEHVINDIGDKIDALIFDDEDTPLGIESTVIDFTVRPFRILRSGFITKRELEDTCGEKFILSGDQDLSKEMKTASSSKIIVFEGSHDMIVSRIRKMYEKLEIEHKGKIGVIVTDGTDEKLTVLSNLKVMGSPTEPEVIAKNFYACLRDFEKKDIEIILVEGIPRDGIGWAIMDRLAGMASEIIKD